MITPMIDCLFRAGEEHHELADYQSDLVPRWCVGCGDNAILTAMQRLCRDEQLDPARTVFVSGIGCSSRLPHYMGTYGFHGTHGRALPIAEGVKMSRPDLPVFVSTGDGDCLSIGAGHWIHAIRYNMDLTVLMHDNLRVFGKCVHHRRANAVQTARYFICFIIKLTARVERCHDGLQCRDFCFWMNTDRDAVAVVGDAHIAIR